MYRIIIVLKGDLETAERALYDIGFENNVAYAYHAYTRSHLTSKGPDGWIRQHDTYPDTNRLISIEDQIIPDGPRVWLDIIVPYLSDATMLKLAWPDSNEIVQIEQIDKPIVMPMCWTD